MRHKLPLLSQIDVPGNFLKNVHYPQPLFAMEQIIIGDTRLRGGRNIAVGSVATHEAY